MLADVMLRVRNRYRNVVEAIYEGSCEIYEMQSFRDPVTKVTGQKEVVALKDIPCRLSFSGSPVAVGTDTVSSVSQIIKLFLAPEWVVKPGSRIVVAQQGRTESYAQSGKASVYASHQEITLELWKGDA